MKTKWVTKQNMVWWILLGISIALFGICFGIWNDKEKKKEEEKKKTIENMTDANAMQTMIDILTESYSADQKIKNIAQINELNSDGFAEYRVILNDKNKNSEEKMDMLKRKVAFRYYLSNDSSLDARTKVQKLEALKFSDTEISNILTDKPDPNQIGGGKRDAQDKINAIHGILKNDL